MRTSIRRCGLAWAIFACATLVSLAAVAETEQERARAIAERFATGKGPEALPAGARRVVPATQPEPAEEQRLNEEIDMLARARAEAEARREELVRAREAAESAEQAAAEKGTAKSAAEQRRTADERQRAEEALRAAEDRRKAEETRQADEARLRAEAERHAEAKRKADEDLRIADERRRAEDARLAAEAQAKSKAEDAQQAAQQAAMEAEREAEAERITETLRKAREARMPRGLQDPRATTSASHDVIEHRPGSRDGNASDDGRFSRGARNSDIAMDGRRPPGWSESRPGEFRPGARADEAGPRERQPDRMRHSTRVAVLLVLEPGNYGIRRNNKTADPLLCGEHGCYVSAGAGLPSELMRKSRVLGVGRTLGSRAGACRNSLGCVFRDVDLLAYPAFVQPVDMHVIKHDRRQPQMLHETSDCRLVAERLACSAFRGPDYTMWVVPEELAEQAGPAALERALEDGLPDAGASSFAPGRQR